MLNEKPPLVWRDLKGATPPLTPTPSDLPAARSAITANPSVAAGEGSKRRLGIRDVLGLPMWAWTTPAAFNNGSAISAADMDTVTDNLTFLGDMTLSGKSFKNFSATSELAMRLLGSDTDSTDRTTTSTTFADITGLSVTVTTGANVLLLFRAPFKVAGVSVGEVTLTFKYDSTTIESTDGIGRFIVNGSNEETVWLIYFLTGLSLGSHTFVPRWRTVTSATATMGAATVHDAGLYVLGVA